MPAATAKRLALRRGAPIGFYGEVEARVGEPRSCIDHIDGDGPVFGVCPAPSLPEASLANERERCLRLHIARTGRADS
jgi:hypothetical protein